MFVPFWKKLDKITITRIKANLIHKTYLNSRVLFLCYFGNQLFIFQLKLCEKKIFELLTYACMCG